MTQPQTVKDYSRIRLNEIITNPDNEDIVVIYRDTKTNAIHFNSDTKSLALIAGMLHLMGKLVDDMSLFPEDYEEKDPTENR